LARGVLRFSSLHRLLVVAINKSSFSERVKRERMEEERKEEEEMTGSSLTMEKVAAAKQFIENHYRAQMKNIRERKER
jgi:hypothetical protein